MKGPVYHYNNESNITIQDIPKEKYKNNEKSI
jgi:hypothetical protein